mgnify:FL=1
MQTRVVACFTDGTGYALGSVEGRCAIQYIDDSKSAGNFSFKVRTIPLGRVGFVLREELSWQGTSRLPGLSFSGRRSTIEGRDPAPRFPIALARA